MIKSQKIKMLLAVGFALSMLTVYCVWEHFQEKQALFTRIDEKLFAAAVAVPFVLDDDFHDLAVDAHSIDAVKDRRNIEELSRLNDRLGMKFLYTIVRDPDGVYRLSSSSALKEELKQGTEVRYYTAYPDVSDVLKKSFEDSKTYFSQRSDDYHVLHVPVYSDRWGTYRSIFVPMRSPSGKAYMIGADIDISYVNTLLKKNFLKTALEFLFFALVILPIIYAYNRVLKQKNLEYQQVHQLYLVQSERSITDPLTQIYNRLKINEELQRVFEHYQKSGCKFSLLMIDIDHFKIINDRYGHHVGDTVLQIIAQLMQESSRLTDVAGRWGGEEFIIICRDTKLDGACQLAEKLRLLIENYVFQQDIKITASFGVVECSSDQTLSQLSQLSDLLQQVDQALYKAKRMGRNRIAIAGKRME